MTDDNHSSKADLTAQILHNVLSSAKKARSQYDDVAKELAIYDFGTERPKEDYFINDIGIIGKIYKVQQYKREIGPRLYNKNPSVKVTPRSEDPLKVARSELMEKYINYCIDQSSFYDDCQECIDDSFTRYGILWFAIDPNNDSVTTAEHVPADDVWFDADSYKLRKGNVLIRRRRKAKWSLAKQYPKMRGTILAQTGVPTNTDSGNESNATDTSTNLIEYYEVYMKVGLHNYREGMDAISAEQSSSKDVPRKYVFIDQASPVLIDEGDWETPFHLDGAWPCEVLWYYPGTKTPYPISPLYTGLTWMRAYNWCAMMLMAKYRWTSQEVLFAVEKMGFKLDDASKDRIGGLDEPVKIIEIAAKQMDDTDVSKLLYQVKKTTNIDEALTILQFCDKQFSQETGLYEFLFIGDPGTQDRSALATEVRDRNSQSRIEHMRSRLDEFLSRVASRIGMMARYHQDPEAIAAVMGDEAGEIWGVLMTQEQMSPAYWGNQFMDDGMGLMDAVTEGKAMAESGVTLEEWIREVDFTVEIGSTVRKSPDEEASVAENANNQLVPTMLNAGLPGPAGKMIAMLAKQMGATESEQAAITQHMDLAQQVIDLQNQINLQAPPMEEGTNNAPV